MRGYDRRFRPLECDALLETAQFVGCPFDFDHQSRRGVKYPSGEGHLGGEAVDEWTKADSLHGSAQGDAKAFDGGFGGQGHDRS